MAILWRQAMAVKSPILPCLIWIVITRSSKSPAKQLVWLPSRLTALERCNYQIVIVDDIYQQI
jgi:hypothetical protein